MSTILDCSKCINFNNKLFGQCPIFLKFSEANRVLEASRQDIDNFVNVSMTYDINIKCDNYCENKQDCKHPIAAISAIVIRDNKFLMGQRIGAHGSDTWCVPGGKIDFGEDWFGATQREVVEETGLNTHGYKFHGLTNDYFPEDNKHFINVIVSCFATNAEQQARIMESDKCKCWEWVSIEDIQDNIIKNKDPLFLSLQNVLKTVDLKSIIVRRNNEYTGFKQTK